MEYETYSIWLAHKTACGVYETWLDVADYCRATNPSAADNALNDAEYWSDRRIDLYHQWRNSVARQTNPPNLHSILARYPGADTLEVIAAVTGAGY